MLSRVCLFPTKPYLSRKASLCLISWPVWIVCKTLIPFHLIFNHLELSCRSVHCDRGAFWVSSYKHAEVILMGRLCAGLCLCNTCVWATIDIAEHICPCIGISLSCLCAVKRPWGRSSPDSLTLSLTIISRLQSWICSRIAKAEVRMGWQSFCYSNRIFKLDLSSVWSQSHTKCLQHAVSLFSIASYIRFLLLDGQYKDHQGLYLYLY